MLEYFFFFKINEHYTSIYYYFLCTAIFKETIKGGSYDNGIQKKLNTGHLQDGGEKSELIPRIREGMKWPKAIGGAVLLRYKLLTQKEKALTATVAIDKKKLQDDKSLSL